LKFLIIRFSSLGDIVLTTPVIRAIVNRYPDAEIHYLTKITHYDVIKGHPLIHRWHLVNKRGKELMDALQRESFDYIIDLHHNLRSRQYKWFLSGKKYSFRKLNVEKWLRVRCGVDVLPRVHIVERYLDTLRPIGIDSPSLSLEYFIPEGERVDVAALHPSLAHPYAVYAIGGQHATKRLPPDAITQLCRMVGVPLVLLGGQGDRAVADEAVRAAGNPMVHSLCGQFNINQSADVVRQARVLLTHDSVLMHIGAAFARPTLVLWGNTIPEFGMYPWQPETPRNVHPFEVRPLKCRPCSKIGFDECPKGHFRCMREQPIPAIVETLHRLMAAES